MVARNLLTVLEIYAAIGVIAAGAFLAVGLDRIDPSARGAYAFRPLVIPGAILLWPLVLRRWLVLHRDKAGKDEARRDEARRDEAETRDPETGEGGI